MCAVYDISIYVCLDYGYTHHAGTLSEARYQQAEPTLSSQAVRDVQQERLGGLAAVYGAAANTRRDENIRVGI